MKSVVTVLLRAAGNAIAVPIGGTPRVIGKADRSRLDQSAALGLVYGSKHVSQQDGIGDPRDTEGCGDAE